MTDAERLIDRLIALSNDPEHAVLAREVVHVVTRRLGADMLDRFTAFAVEDGRCVWFAGRATVWFDDDAEAIVVRRDHGDELEFRVVFLAGGDRHYRLPKVA